MKPIRSAEPRLNRMTGSPERSGFTYLEVLVALGILLGLSVAVSISLGRVLGAEARAVMIQEGGLELQKLSTLRLTGRPVEASTSPDSAWRIVPDPDQEAAGWELWRLEAVNRPSLGFPAALIATGRTYAPDASDEEP